MIIKAKRHGYITVLTLNSKVLKEGSERGEIRMHVKLSDIKRALKNGDRNVRGHWEHPSRAEREGMLLVFHAGRIGCCSFKTEEFKKIVDAAKRVE